MIPASTLNEFVRFAYNELPVLERLEAEDLLEREPAAMRAFEQMMLAKQELPPVRFQPTPAAIRRVLSYSRNPRLEPSL